MDLCDDQHAMAGSMRVFQKLSDTDKEFQAVKIQFNFYFHTLSPYCRDHVWSPMGVKEVAHVWWFISGSIGKLLASSHCVEDPCLGSVLFLMRAKLE
jgi:hypothetical protein